jgi:GNAT superfamily N-acetyltransferase
MAEKDAVLVRNASRGDVGFILRCILELAAYEHSEDQVKATEESLTTWLFDEQVAHCLIVELDGEARGFALYFTNFSTWEGVPGLFLEDLYVQPEVRGRGLGTALFRRLAQMCVERGFTRLEWMCLDWNAPSLAFYKSLGAIARTQWISHRLEMGEIRRLAVGE